MSPEPNPETHDPDWSLVQRAQGGDLDAFEELIARHQSCLTGLLHRFCPHGSDLEDLVQDTFVRAWRGLAGWTPQKPFIHWLKRIAVRVGYDYALAQSRSPLGHTQGADPSGQSPLETLSADADPAADQLGALDTVRHLLAQLPPRDRTLLSLYYLEELPTAEIADLLGWSRGRVKVEAFRARHRLKSILKKHGYTDF